jgi:hypothetical protein
MKTSLLVLGLTILTPTLYAQSDLRTFSNAEGETLQDRIVKYDHGEQVVTLEKNGRLPLPTFCEADQKYIQQWNRAEGFKSTMRFKIELQQKNWARMKHEQTITPFFLDAVGLPGKKTPIHHLLMLDDYEEYNAVYLEAKGYEIILRNQNFFPLENIVVESKVFYEQEYYTVPDDLLASMESEYNDVAITNKVRFLSETVPAIIPREEVVLHSDCAITVDHQVDRSNIADSSGEEDDEETGEESAAGGLGEWDDHGRRRTGKLIGIWVRIGTKDADGNMIWREMTDPTSLPDKVSWEPATPPVE